MIRLKPALALVLILLVLIVVLQNTQAVETRFLFVSFIMPRAALLAVTFLAGAAAGILLSISLTKRLPRKRGNARRRA